MSTDPGSTLLPDSVLARPESAAERRERLKLLKLGCYVARTPAGPHVSDQSASAPEPAPEETASARGGSLVGLGLTEAELRARGA